MALVSGGFEGAVTLIDTKGTETTIKLQLNVADYAAAEAAVLAYVNAITPLTNSIPSGYTVGRRYVEDAFAYPVAADNWDELYMTLQIDGSPNKVANIRVPSPINGNTQPSDTLLWAGTSGDARKVANLSNPELVAWVNLHQAGGTIYVSDGEIAGAPQSGRLRQGRRRAT